MHDARELLDLGYEAVRRLERRGHAVDLGAVEHLQARHARGLRAADELRAESRRLSGDVQLFARPGEDLSELKQRARAVKDQIRQIDAELGALQAELDDLLLGIPSLPDDRAPDGDSPEAAVEVRRAGTPGSLGFEPRDHVELAESAGLLDFARATQLSGPGFAVSRGAGAALERGLVALFLDLHTRRHGYAEHGVPQLLTRRALTAAGQPPAAQEELFATAVDDRELLLIPGPGAALSVLRAEEVISASDLPVAMVAHAPCFRPEVGAYGRDSRGLMRQHQSTAVELVRLCDPDDADAQLEAMLGHAEACLQELGLVCRVVRRPAGQLDFAAELTFGLEAWLPAQGAYREVAAVSSLGTFQARRANIRTRGVDGTPRHVATIRGSALQVGPTLAAVLEQGQQEDGSVVLPEALAPHLGFRRIAADGTAGM